MKNLFLALLLANVLFLAWERWISPPDVPATRLRSPGSEMEVVAAGAPEPSPAAPEAAPPGDPPASPCVRVGPIADGQAADSLRARLIASGATAALEVEEAQIWVGHWVQLESVGSRAEADRAVARLAAGGLTDAYILQPESPHAISLGIFRDRERADAVAAKAAALGFSPTISDRYRAGVEYWLSLVLPAGRSLALEDLNQASGQPLGAHAVPCPGESVGGQG